MKFIHIISPKISAFQNRLSVASLFSEGLWKFWSYGALASRDEDLVCFKKFYFCQLGVILGRKSQKSHTSTFEKSRPWTPASHFSVLWHTSVYGTALPLLIVLSNILCYPKATKTSICNFCRAIQEARLNMADIMMPRGQVGLGEWWTPQHTPILTTARTSVTCFWHM